MKLQNQSLVTLQLVIDLFGDEFNSFCKRNKLPLQMNFDRLKESKEFNKLNRHINEKDVKLFRNSIRAAFDWLKVWLTTGQKVAYQNLTQLGKTLTTSIVGSLVAPLFKLLKNQTAIVIALTPGNNSLGEQFSDDIWKIMYLLQNIVFINTKTKQQTTLKECWIDIEDSLKDSISAKQFKLIRDLGHFSPAIVTASIRPNSLEAFNILADHCDSHTKHVLCFIQDEAHAWAKENSMLDKKLSQSVENSIYRRINDKSRSRIMTAVVSATLFDYITAIDSGEMILVNQEVQCHCIGFNRSSASFNYQKFYDGNLVTPPVMLSLSEVADKLRNRTISRLNPADYAEACKGEDRKMLNKYHKAVHQLTQYVFDREEEDFSKHPCLAEKGKGIILRYADSNKYAEPFCTELEELYGREVIVIRGFGENLLDSTTFKELIEEKMKHEPEANFILVVTGSCRMGDQLPENCFCAIDLTKICSNLTALLQGSAGRITGYKPYALLIMSDANINTLKRWVDGKEFTPTELSGNLASAHDTKSKSVTFTIVQEPELCRVFNRFLKLSGGKEFSQKHNFAEILTPTEMERLQSTLPEHQILEPIPEFYPGSMRSIKESAKKGGTHDKKCVVRTTPTPNGNYEVVEFELRVKTLTKVKSKGGTSAKYALAA